MTRPSVSIETQDLQQRVTKHEDSFNKGIKFNCPDCGILLKQKGALTRHGTVNLYLQSHEQTQYL